MHECVSHFQMVDRRRMQSSVLTCIVHQIRGRSKDYVFEIFSKIFLMCSIISIKIFLYICSTTTTTPDQENRSNHKVKIRKALGPALQEVNDEPPAGLSALESAALEQEEDDPIDIFLDFDLPFESRLEAQDRLKDAGFTFNSPMTDEIDLDIESFKNESGVDSHDTATDEGLVPEEEPVDE